MKSCPGLLAIIWVPASILLAQDPAPPKSDVRVVFAPDSRARTHTRAEVRSIPFETPDGAVGIRLTDEFATGATVSVGDDGKPRLQCGPLRSQKPEAKAAKSTSPGGRKEWKREK